MDHQPTINQPSTINHLPLLTALAHIESLRSRMGIIDNWDGNTLLSGLSVMSKSGTELRIATAFFSLDALLKVADT